MSRPDEVERTPEDSLLLELGDLATRFTARQISVLAAYRDRDPEGFADLVASARARADHPAHVIIAESGRRVKLTERMEEIERADAAAKVERRAETVLRYARVVLADAPEEDHEALLRYQFRGIGDGLVREALAAAKRRA